MTPRRALELIRSDYCRIWHDSADELARLSTTRGTEARIVKYGDDVVLICTGSNSGWDWLRNFWFLSDWWSEQGYSKRRYHRGHLRGAREVWGWICTEFWEQHSLVELRGMEVVWGEWRTFITHVIGHSRGGAIASIVGSSLEVPTITFACPPHVVDRWLVNPGDKHVTNYCGRFDPVCWMPPWMRRIGRAKWMPVLGHRVKRYWEKV